MSNLLSTNTVNFQELLGNGKTYKVPMYQRDYSWTEEQWEDLWQDIQELRPDAAKRHYMGAIVVKAESDRQFMIIDGQQRIATLTILALAIIKALQDSSRQQPANSERAVALRSRYIGEKDPASLTEVSKLDLNHHDDGFFKDYLVQLRTPINPKSLSRSNKLLWDCFVYFSKQLKTVPDFQTNGEELAALLSEVIARRLMFISITVDNELNAYTVFETLNARGLELTTTDLLKNYLFAKIPTVTDLEALQRRWNTLVGLVHQERFGDFLRYHYLTKYKQVRKERLFKVAQEEIKASSDVFELMQALENRAELFDALDDPYHSFWSERPEAKPYIRELALFKVKSMTPLLFASYEQHEPAEFVRVLKSIVVISFRYLIIGGLNPNLLEPTYHIAAKAVLDQKTTARQVFDLLSPIYVDDNKFESDFAQAAISTKGQRKKIVKYILTRLEQDASGRDIDFETDPSTIEHILPENPNEFWDASIPQQNWDTLVYRLGNLALLNASSNREIGNQGYVEKISHYQSSAYRTTQQIPSDAPSEWTQAHIIERQKRMATRAKHIWRSDFV